MVVQREIENAGIPTILVSALPPVARQYGTPRSVAPRVPMGANFGEPHNQEKQKAVLKETLQQLVEIDAAGKIVNLPYEYSA